MCGILLQAASRKPQAASRKPQDKEAEAVNEALRENGAQQTRPMGAEVARRRWGSEARAQPVPTGRSFKSGGRGW